MTFRKKLGLTAASIALLVVTAMAATKMQNLIITSSTIDSTPIGAASPSTVNATSVTANSLNASSATINSLNATTTTTNTLNAIASITTNFLNATGFSLSGGALTSSTINSTPIGGSSPAAVNATLYQINGTAPSGHTLCGNGTSYVDQVKCNPPNYNLNDVTGSRFFTGTFQNNSGYDMDVYINGIQSGGVGQDSDLTGYIGSSPGSLIGVFHNGSTNGPGRRGIYLHVPNGWYYQATFVPTSGSPSLSLLSWVEGTWS